MEAIDIFFRTLFDESGVLILLFIVTGLVFNVFGEIIKKTLWPKLTEEDVAKGKKQKEVPGWFGIVIGVILTVLFLCCTMLAQVTSAAHCALIGGYAFLPVWAIAYYLWQMVGMKIVKWLMKKICPLYMTGIPRPPRPKKEPTVPAGYKLVKEDTEVIDG